MLLSGVGGNQVMGKFKLKNYNKYRNILNIKISF